MVTTRPPGARTIDEILEDARLRLLRVPPHEAFREMAGGAVLIDIRPAAQRSRDGEIPGSVVVERNHLEWRVDPCSDARLPWVTGYDHRIIVFCQDGYTLSLAAAALLDLGLYRATDMTGGFTPGWPRVCRPPRAARPGSCWPPGGPGFIPGYRSSRVTAGPGPGRSRLGGTGRSRPGRSGWRRPLPAWACARRATTAR